MTTVKSVKTWYLIHKWTSLICTAFLLMLCLTGLPLIFHAEIDKWMGEGPVAQEMPANTAKASLDKIAETGIKKYPGKVVRYVFWRDEVPNTVTLSIADSIAAHPGTDKYLSLDERTADILQDKKDEGFMHFVLQLHIDMFLGIGGKLFLGLMGILFILAIISGMMLYGPIMRKYDFGLVREDKSPRIKWLDLHNLLGVVTLAWVIVVGSTGVINTMSDIVLLMWQNGQLAEMVAPYKSVAPIKGALSSLDDAVKTSKKAAPEMRPSIVAYPGTVFTSKHHYAVFMKGNTPVTARLIKPALIDAQNGRLTDMRDMPWYVNALFISQPLHFGDYGGMPMKIIWAVFDLITIVVLGSGLYLWFARNKATTARIERMEVSDKEILPITWEEIKNE